MPSREPTENCRIFVSRKRSDRSVVAKEIQKKMMTIAAGRLEFFDDTDIQFGDKWRREIRKELDKANILVLVLTKPAKDDFDWPLYEAGLFEDLTEGRQGRVVCLHPLGEKRPSQLDERQSVEATESNLLTLLCSIYKDKNFTNTVSALNPLVEDDDLQPIARQISDRINGIESAELRSVDHGNKWIEFVFPKGVDSLGPEVEVTSSKRSLGDLFDLPEKPARAKTWTSCDLEQKAQLKGDSQGFNLLWSEELRTEIAARRDPDCQRAGHQLTGRYLGRDGKLYRPEIEICREYADGTMRLDVTFSEQVHESWLRATPLVALAAMIALASRIRHELIEPYLRKLPRWRLQGSIEDGFANLAALTENIERNGFFIGILTKDRFADAFDKHEGEATRLGELQREFQETIRPQLMEALEKHDIDLAKQALQEWKENNGRFLDIGITVYRSGLGLDEAA